MQIGLVIPVFNEQANIEKLYARVRPLINEYDSTAEILFVDDGSSDNTWSLVEKIARQDPNVHGIKLSRNFGKESALVAGLESISKEIAIVMDGDLQHPPEILHQLIKKWQETGCNVVEAVKESRGEESAFSLVSASTYYWLLTKLTNYDFQGASDYKLLDRLALDSWLELKERSVFFRGMVAWIGLHREKIPFRVESTDKAESGWTVGQLVNLALTSITAFSTFPLRLITIFGLTLAVFALFLALQTLFMKFSGKAVDGFTTVILIQLFVGSSIVMALGIIGEYIARIYEEVKHRPRYLIAKRTPKKN